MRGGCGSWGEHQQHVPDQVDRQHLPGIKWETAPIGRLSEELDRVRIGFRVRDLGRLSTRVDRRSLRRGTRTHVCDVQSTLPAAQSVFYTRLTL